MRMWIPLVLGVACGGVSLAAQQEREPSRDATAREALELLERVRDQLDARELGDEQRRVLAEALERAKASLKRAMRESGDGRGARGGGRLTAEDARAGIDEQRRATAELQARIESVARERETRGSDLRARLESRRADVAAREQAMEARRTSAERELEALRARMGDANAEQRAELEARIVDREKELQQQRAEMEREMVRMRRDLERERAEQEREMQREFERHEREMLERRRDLERETAMRQRELQERERQVQREAEMRERELVERNREIEREMLARQREVEARMREVAERQREARGHEGGGGSGVAKPAPRMPTVADVFERVRARERLRPSADSFPGAEAPRAEPRPEPHPQPAPQPRRAPRIGVPTPPATPAPPAPAAGPQQHHHVHYHYDGPGALPHAGHDPDLAEQIRQLREELAETRKMVDQLRQAVRRRASGDGGAPRPDRPDRPDRRVGSGRSLRAADAPPTTGFGRAVRSPAPRSGGGSGGSARAPRLGFPGGFEAVEEVEVVVEGVEVEEVRAPEAPRASGEKGVTQVTPPTTERFDLPRVVAGLLWARPSTEPRRLVVGQELRLPAFATAPNASAAVHLPKRAAPPIESGRAAEGLRRE